MTTFKGTLFTPIYDDILKPKYTNHYLEFTENQIIFPDKFKDIRYENSAIKDRVNYSIVITKNVDMRFRYEITTGGQTFKLGVKKSEEKKLRQIHGLAWYSVIPIKWDLIKMGVTFILGLISSLLLFLLNYQLTMRKNEEVKLKMDSLQTRIFLLEKDATAHPTRQDTTYLKRKPVSSQK